MDKFPIEWVQKLEFLHSHYLVLRGVIKNTL